MSSAAEVSVAISSLADVSSEAMSEYHRSLGGRVLSILPQIEFFKGYTFNDESLIGLEEIKESRESVLFNLLDTPPQKLSCLAFESEKCKQLLKQAQLRIGYVLVCNTELSLDSLDGLFEKTDEYGVVDYIKRALQRGEGEGLSQSDKVMSLMGGLQQKLSFALGSALVSGQVEMDKFNKPLNPFEKDLLDIINNKTPNPIPAYTAHHVLGAPGFYRENYKPYIKEGVIYQDYLRKIDKPLLTALRGALSKGNKKAIIPPAKEKRITKYQSTQIKKPSVKK